MSRLLFPIAAVIALALAGPASAALLQFHANLDTAQEVPPKAGTGGGEALITLDSATRLLSYTVTFDGLSGPATAAHFHGPAAKGTNAGAVSYTHLTLPTILRV